MGNSSQTIFRRSRGCYCSGSMLEWVCSEIGISNIVTIISLLASVPPDDSLKVKTLLFYSLSVPIRHTTIGINSESMRQSLQMQHVEFVGLIENRNSWFLVYQLDRRKELSNRQSWLRQGINLFNNMLILITNHRNLPINARAMISPSCNGR